MRVLLTGGAGFIGRPVRSRVAEHGHEVRVLDSLRADVHGGRPRPAFDLLVGDVRHAAPVDKALVGVDAVIHLAAKVGLGVDTQDYPDYADCNVRGTAVLLAAMDRAGGRRLVQASSMVVFGPGLGRCARHGLIAPAPRSLDDLRAGRFEPPCPVCGEPLAAALVDEDAPLDPRNVYAISKVGQEQLSTVWAEECGADVTNLRYHNVYGPGLPRDTPYAGVAAIFLSALRRGVASRVFEDGRQRRDFVHVRDVAAATVAALAAEPAGVRAVNIGSGTPPTVGEFALVLARARAGRRRRRPATSGLATSATSRPIRPVLARYSAGGRRSSSTPAWRSSFVTEPACPAHARRWLAITFAAYVGLFAVLLHVNWRDAPFALAAGSAAMFVALIFLLHRAESAIAHIGLVIVGGGLLLQIVAVTTGPTTSDDVYRYIWDGKVQLAGTDPYAYAPQATQLRHLRDDSLFGPRSGCTYPIPDGSCTVINRPKVNTVYPPVAEGAFDAVRLVSAGGDGGTRAFQVAAAAGTVAISIMLLAWARAARRRLWAVAMWAWSPVVVIEFGNNAHIDWVAVLFSLGALRMCRARLPGWAGLLAGAAILTKIYPALLVPVLLRRRPLVVIGAGLGFGILAYIPHVLAVGSKVVGYLPGYLHEEGYESGSRLLLLGLVFPHPLDSVAAVLVLVIVAWWGARRCDPDRPEIAATILTGATFLVLTPSYGWYAALLIALIAWSGRFEWLPVAAAPTFVYLMRIGFNHSTIPSNIVYALAALLTIALAVRRGAMPVPSRWPAAVRRVAERV